MKTVKISLNRPVILDGVPLAKGTHEVAKSSIIENWFFDALIAAEHAVVLSVIEKIKEKVTKKNISNEVVNTTSFEEIKTDV